jgi:uridine kinase
MNQAIKIVDAKIKRLSKPILIGISGFGGSGKSTFALALGEKLKAPVVGVDSFAKHNVHKDYEFWDIIDFNLIEKEVIKPFLSWKQEISYKEFDWKKNGFGEQVSFKNHGILVIEGIGLFRPALMKYFSCTLWVDCPMNEAIIRGKKRDREDPNKPQHDAYWDGIWKENDLQCFEHFSPKQKADFIVNHHKIGQIFIA